MPYQEDYYIKNKLSAFLHLLFGSVSFLQNLNKKTDLLDIDDSSERAEVILEIFILDAVLEAADEDLLDGCGRVHALGGVLARSRSFRLHLGIVDLQKSDCSWITRKMFSYKK